MIPTTTPSLNTNPIFKTLQMTDSPHFPASYTFNKLDALRPNPSLLDDNDDIYQTTKKIKTYNGESYNMQKPNKYELESYHSVPHEEEISSVSRDTDSAKKSDIQFYQPTHHLSQAPMVDMGAGQTTSQGLLNHLLLQNLYNNLLMEAEVLRRYNELQELARFQTANNNPLTGDFTSLFLLSLYEKQRQDYENLQVLQRAQQGLSGALNNRQMEKENIFSRRNENEKKNPEVITILDDEDESQVQVDKGIQVNGLEKNLPEESNIKAENVIYKEIMVMSPSTTEEEEEQAKARGLVLEKTTVTQIKREKVLTAKQRAENRWKALKEYKEFLKTEAEKPYVINLHADLNDPNQKINKTLVGTNHQAKVLPFKLNQKKRTSRNVKLAWRPDLVEPSQMEENFARMENALGEKITNQEKAIKLFLILGMEIEAVIDEIEKNKMFYRSYFKTAPRVLRKREGAAV